MTRKQKASDEQITEAYIRLKSVWEVGKEFGMCGQSVHERIKKLGFVDEDKWTEEQIVLLTRFYTEKIFSTRDKMGLEELAQRIGKLKTNVCRKARELGLTNIKRRLSQEYAQKMGQNTKEWIAENGHPKGMLGKKHSEEAKRQIEEKMLSILQMRHARGTLYSPATQKNGRKPGVRCIGGKEIAFRSSWEANYARYLQLMVENGKIQKWEFEPETFWFDKIQRGCRSYLPDFKVWDEDGTFFFVEVKGWMDQKSATKLKRMETYYPETMLILVDANKMKHIEKSYSHLIPDWEFKTKIKRKGAKK